MADNNKQVFYDFTSGNEKKIYVRIGDELHIIIIDGAMQKVSEKDLTEDENAQVDDLGNGNYAVTITLDSGITITIPFSTEQEK